MIEFVDLCIDMQKRVIEVHEKSMEAAQKTLKGANASVAMQQAMQEATKANVAAWDRWVSLWTGGSGTKRK